MTEERKRRPTNHLIGKDCTDPVMRKKLADEIREMRRRERDDPELRRLINEARAALGLPPRSPDDRSLGRIVRCDSFEEMEEAEMMAFGVSFPDEDEEQEEPEAEKKE